MEYKYNTNHHLEGGIKSALALCTLKFQGTAPASIVYKAPGQANGKIIVAGAAGNWQDGAVAITAANGHSFAKALEHVVGNDGAIKFLAYNNVPPRVPKVKTKSNSKGYLNTS
ncbi:hypothetical protein T10_7081 [Trichinella papuae]|uniref:Uncharacterized protein n=1 Tax=Trichinella papuae TaxID=268474 RepID=A0A0V1M7I0_9BILA|nr:hypothetical protein T10_60 [Trichinella papuae]KRZ67766.1 hypothetical protein T10_7081 [Trichinella papuae]